MTHPSSSSIRTPHARPDPRCRDAAAAWSGSAGEVCTRTGRCRDDGRPSSARGRAADRPDRAAARAARARGEAQGDRQRRDQLPAQHRLPSLPERGIQVITPDGAFAPSSPRRRSAWRSTWRAGSPPRTAPFAPAPRCTAWRPTRLFVLTVRRRADRLRRSRPQLRRCWCRSAPRSRSTTRGCRTPLLGARIAGPPARRAAGDLPRGVRVRQLTTENQGFLGAREFALMRPGSSSC